MSIYLKSPYLLIERYHNGGGGELQDYILSFFLSFGGGES